MTKVSKLVPDAKQTAARLDTWLGFATKCLAQGGAGSKRLLLGCDPAARHGAPLHARASYAPARSHPRKPGPLLNVAARAPIVGAFVQRISDSGHYSSIISKSAFVAEQSGQPKVSGTSAHRVPGAIPSSGRPAASSYTKAQSTHCQVLNATAVSAAIALAASGLPPPGTGKLRMRPSMPSGPATSSNGPSFLPTHTIVRSFLSLPS